MPANYRIYAPLSGAGRGTVGGATNSNVVSITGVPTILRVPLNSLTTYALANGTVVSMTATINTDTNHWATAATDIAAASGAANTCADALTVLRAGC